MVGGKFKVKEMEREDIQESNLLSRPVLSSPPWIMGRSPQTAGGGWKCKKIVGEKKI